MARPESSKNIWIAAGDGDIERVKELVEEQGMSPNSPDNVIGYTPMHAAASYGHLELLTYLISRGGDVNVADEDGDTPLYAAESVQVAEFLVTHGAQVDITNSENISPAEATEEDFPDVAAYIRSKSSLPQAPATHEAASEEMTDELITRAEAIIARAEAEGRDPHDEIASLVGRTVFGGMAWAQENDPARGEDMPER